MVDERELRRRAQPLLDRPSYEPLPLDELRDRAADRTRRTRRRLIAGLCTVVVAAGTIGAVVQMQGEDGRNVAVRTTHTAVPPVTVPSNTTIADLRFTPIAGPDGDTPVTIYAVGDQFLAVTFGGENGEDGLERAWIGDAAGKWRALDLPADLRGARIGRTVQQVGKRVVALGTIANDKPLVLEGASLAGLKVSHWTSEAASIPAAIHRAPPPGHSIVVSGSVESTAVGEAGIVMAGRISATLDRDLLPQSVRDTLNTRPGRIDVRDGRVIAIVGGVDEPIFDRPASELGLTPAEVEYLTKPDDERDELAVWGAAWGEPIRQLSVTGIDVRQTFGNVHLFHVSDGFVLYAPSAFGNLYFSRDGREWNRLASAQREVMELTEVGSRWVSTTARIVSGDHGRSWDPIDLGRDGEKSGTGSLYGGWGSSGFGLFGSTARFDNVTFTTSPGRLHYSPDGVRWSSVALDDLLHFEANVPFMAVGDSSAILRAGLRADGDQPQRYWLVTRRE